MNLENSFQITDVTIFNGEEVIEKAHVIVIDGYIQEVLNLKTQKIPTNSLKTINGRGKFLMPSLIESEGHFMLTSETYLHFLSDNEKIFEKDGDQIERVLRPSYQETYQKFSENNLLRAQDNHCLYGIKPKVAPHLSMPNENTSFEKYMRFGVTTVLDMAAYPWPANYFKRPRDKWKKFSNPAHSSNKELQDLKKEFMIYADLFTSGMWAIPANLQFGYFGVDPVYNLSPDGPWEFSDIEKWIDRRITEGSDHIKIFYHSWGKDFPSDTQFTPQTLNAIVKAGHDRNLLAYTHNQVESDAYAVMESKSDALIHTPGSAGELKTVMFSDEFSKKLVSSVKFIVPTLGVLLQNCKSPYSIANRSSHTLSRTSPGESFVEKYIESKDVLPYIYATDEIRLLSCDLRGKSGDDEIILKKVASIFDNGAFLLTGTDPDTSSSAIEGLGIHYELFLIKEALEKYSVRIRKENLNLEVLKTATSNPAMAYGLHLENNHKPKHDPRGFIKKGYRADLILLSESPLENILNTLKIESIFKAGYLIERKMVRPEYLNSEAPTRKIIRALMKI